jgi:hypothetical protein
MFQFLMDGPMVGTGTRAYPNHIRLKRVDGHGPSTRANQFLFAAQFQLIGQRQVALIIMATQISQQSAALAHHLKQTPAAGLIVIVSTQMVSELENAGGQDGHLDFRRTGISLVAVVIRNNLGLDFLVKRHDVCNSFSLDFEQVSAPAGLAAGGTSQCGQDYTRKDRIFDFKFVIEDWKRITTKFTTLKILRAGGARRKDLMKKD